MKNKIKFSIMIIAAIFIVIAILLLYLGRPNENSKNPQREIKWGMTFSATFAEKMGFDPKIIFQEMLDDLKIKNLRLIAYWPEIEITKGQYYFGELDWQIEKAQQANAKIILSMGRRLPRWPECHEPQWIKNQTIEDTNQELLDYIQATINYYKNNQAIWAWQIENEPFLNFGECPRVNPEFLDKEISLVKSLDNRPVIITDSGELSIWYSAAKRADIFGTTMYRKVNLWPLGSITYPLPPGFFRAKERILKTFINLKNPMFVIELQGEPWSDKLLYETNYQDDLKRLNLNEFRGIIEYAKSAGFNEYYLWGAEWWYKMKENGHPEFWDEARTIYQ